MMALRATKPKVWCRLGSSELRFNTVKDKCYAVKPETINAWKDNNREAIGEMQLHTIDNVLKN